MNLYELLSIMCVLQLVCNMYIYIYIYIHIFNWFHNFHMDVGHQPLSSGLWYRARENQIPRLFCFALYWSLVFFWFLVPGCPQPGCWRELFTLLAFRPTNRNLVMTISIISMRQNRSITIFGFKGGRG